MKKKVTIRDVAERAGISITTVSQILNNKGERFSEETKQRVLKARDALGYEPNYFARGLGGQSGNSIGVVIPDIMNPFFASLVVSIEAAAIPRGYFPQVFSVNGFHENIDYFIEQFSSGTQKGLILAAPGASSEIVSRLSADSLPMVFTDQADVLDRGDMVLINELEAGDILASHLLAEGHRRIAIVLPKQMATNLVKRYEGYERAFARYGLAIDKALVFHEEFSPAGGRHAVESIVKTDATAIISINDDVATGIYRGLMLHGKKIPGDYSVVGFDNISQSHYMTPPLTTIAQPIQEIGTQIVKLILARMVQPNRPYQDIRLATEIKVRESTRKI